MPRSYAAAGRHATARKWYSVGAVDEFVDVLISTSSALSASSHSIPADPAAAMLELYVYGYLKSGSV
jgi:hypothetical protein